MILSGKLVITPKPKIASTCICKAHCLFLSVLIHQRFSIEGYIKITLELQEIVFENQK